MNDLVDCVRSARLLTVAERGVGDPDLRGPGLGDAGDRKSTRLNSSPRQNSYAGFFFNDTATTEIYTLSLHDALPISPDRVACRRRAPSAGSPAHLAAPAGRTDERSGRLCTERAPVDRRGTWCR